MPSTPTIAPFRVAIPESDRKDLISRLANTRWPEAEVVSDWSQGVPLSYLQALVQDWRSTYNWQACEDWLNTMGLEQVTLGSQTIVFMHIKSGSATAQPLLLSHGWPGSLLEFRALIPLLTSATAEQSFHLVIPCLPGFGFSSKPEAPGTGIAAIAHQFDQLMQLLGYQQYFAHGGDWGSIITQTLPLIPDSGVQGIHVTLPIVQPDPNTFSDLTAEEQAALDAAAHYARWDNGYSQQQASRPQTIGYALADSPVGQLAWIVEKFWSWTDCERDGIAMPDNAISRTAMLDTVSLYWFTNTAASSARLYWESFHPTGALPAIDCPTGMSVFPFEIFKASRRWVETRFSDLRYWSTPPHGGHFAAIEQPELLAQEIRACFKTMI